MTATKLHGPDVGLSFEEATEPAHGVAARAELEPEGGGSGAAAFQVRWRLLCLLLTSCEAIPGRAGSSWQAHIPPACLPTCPTSCRRPPRWPWRATCLGGRRSLWRHQRSRLDGGWGGWLVVPARLCTTFASQGQLAGCGPRWQGILRHGTLPPCPALFPLLQVTTRAHLEHLTASPGVQQAAKQTLVKKSAEVGRSDDSISRQVKLGLLAA